MAWPGRKQAWPNRAEGWSPALPQMGMPARSSSPGMPVATRPNREQLGRGSGSKDCGMSSAAHRSASHRRVRMLNSMVREALE